MIWGSGNTRKFGTLLLFSVICGLFSNLWFTYGWDVRFKSQQVVHFPTNDEIKSSSSSKNTTLIPRILQMIIPQQAWVRYPNVAWKGYQLPLLTALPSGRLGNVLMEYASLFALSRLYNVSAVVHPEMAKTLKLFDHISLPHMPGPYITKDWTIIKSLEGNFLNYAPLQLAASGLLGPHRFVALEWPHEIRLFDLVRDEIRQEFTWNKSIRDMVQLFMKNQRLLLEKKGIFKPVFIGLHVRRTDYVNYIKVFGAKNMPNHKYFSRAFDYYKKKYSDSFFIISSDDRNYVEKEFKSYKDSFSLTPGQSPQVDMAILNACNHSIITVGTFSFWAGYLTGGEVLYPDIDFKNRDYYFQKAYYEGIGLYFKSLPVK